MDRKEEIKKAVEKLAYESMAALGKGDHATPARNVAAVQALLKEFVTLIPDGKQKTNLLKSITQGDGILANEAANNGP